MSILISRKWTYELPVNIKLRFWNMKLRFCNASMSELLTSDASPAQEERMPAATTPEGKEFSLTFRDLNQAACLIISCCSTTITMTLWKPWRIRNGNSDT